ncbi:MAG: hypothetical protein JAY85_17180, partial [Candidatus Thiodiazotropha weberae]|nr:hypothetical protein [Candidatus Thiodiazotropha weberae]
MSIRPERRPVAPKVVEEAVVAVTEPRALTHRIALLFSPARHWLLLMLALLPGFSLFATVLPEDRADIMYHRYDGGGVEVDGPSILVRKSVMDTVSL